MTMVLAVVSSAETRPPTRTVSPLLAAVPRTTRDCALSTLAVMAVVENTAMRAPLISAEVPGKIFAGVGVTDRQAPHR